MTTTMLSNTQVERFAEEGYLLFDDLLDPADDLDPIIEEYESVLDRIASELYEQGETISRYDGLPFGERLTRITNETGKSLVRFFSPYLPPRNTERDTPFWAGPAVFNAIRNDKIMDAIEPLIGGEIYASPIQNVRLKIPEHLLPRDPKTGAPLDGATPWHQDGAFFEPEVDGVDMVTVWFPLSDATIENGCLAVLPGSHREGFSVHCPQGTKVNPAGLDRISEKTFDIDALVPLPMKRGGAIVFHRRLIHGSLPNKSEELRWSMDLRYLPVGKPTGYPQLPGFVARSRTDASSELRAPELWHQTWLDCRERLAENPAPPLHARWSANDPVCN